MKSKQMLKHQFSLVWFYVYNFYINSNLYSLWADDEALSWGEFKAFFSDGILSTAELEKLFHEIDTHNTK